MESQEKAEAVVDAMADGPWYHFSQNNSGGYFHIRLNEGITEDVVVQADTLTEAVERAESVGLYFDGSGDCECCGNRWESYGVQRFEGKLAAIDYIQSGYRLENSPIAFHYRSGRFVLHDRRK